MIISNSGKQPIFRGNSVSLRNRTIETETSTEKLYTKKEAESLIKKEKDKDDTFIYTRLNSILRTKEQMNEFINYFREKKSPLKEHEKYDGFTISSVRAKQPKIIYEPLNIEFIYDANIKKTLVYEYENYGLGKGIDLFYEHIRSKYFGITRTDVEDFLKSRGDYILSQPQKHRTNKPIEAKDKKKLFAIDLIDLTNLNKSFEPEKINFNYLFVCIDVFTRYVLIEGMVTKDEDESINTFLKILKRPKMFSRTIFRKPELRTKIVTVNKKDTLFSVMSDRGGEFISDKFQNFCRNNKIAQRFTRSSSPQANGVVERVNQEIRKIMNQLYVDNGLIYPLKKKDLETIETAKNTSHHPIIDNTPYNLWNTNDAEILDKARENAKEKNLEKTEKYKNENVFKIGDPVLLEMSVYYASMRAKIKAKDTKGIVVWYMPKIWRIKRVVASANTVTDRRRYVLEPDDNPAATLVTNTAFKRTDYQNQVAFIYGSKLVKIDEDLDLNSFGATDEERLTQALQMNGVEENSNDLIVKELL